MTSPMAAAQAIVYDCTVQILAYLVIVPVGALQKYFLTTGGQDPLTSVEVHVPEHRLPLAEVTVR